MKGSSVSAPGTMRVGHTGITWPATPDGAGTAIRELGELGYPGIELFGFLLDAYPGGISGLRTELDASGLQLAAAYCFAPLLDPGSTKDDIARMTGWAKTVRALGGDVIVVGASARQQKDYATSDYDRLCTTLNEIGARCSDSGVRACFHPHTGTPVETREEIDRVMDRIDTSVVSLAPDTGQIAKGGGDPLEVVQTYARLVRHVHLKDYVGGPTITDAAGTNVDRTGYADYVPLGEGVVELNDVVRTLEREGFAGWLMAELDGTPLAPHPPREAAAINKRWLNRLSQS